uniref:Si:ch211-1a19.3 n=2 Tax=Hucho hucho TaxID=62062 RepID=A0A4W5NCF5_9TELE
MTRPKLSKIICKIMIACLFLWSVSSLIIIVVWATSPNMKGASQCRADLQNLTEKHEGARVLYAKNKQALEEMVEEGRTNQTRQLMEMERFLKRLGKTNVSLADCHHDSVILGVTITVLGKEIEVHKEIEANLTSEITLRQEHIKFLQENLTQASHKWESCEALHSATESQWIAAESQAKACESSKQYLQKQLQMCKVNHHNEPVNGGVAAPQSSILALSIVLFVSLHLMTCECNSTRH